MEAGEVQKPAAKIAPFTPGSEAQVAYPGTYGWQDLEDIRREWFDFAQTLEEQMHKHVQRQELMLDQHATRVEGLLAITHACKPVAASAARASSRATMRATVRASSRSTFRAKRSVRSSGDLSISDDSDMGHENSFKFEPQLLAAESYRKRRMMSLRLENMRSTFGESFWQVCGNWINWWLELQEPTKNSRLLRLVEGQWFEAVCAAVIIANGVFTVHLTNYEASTLTEDKSTATRAINACFVLFYTMELVLKLAAHRLWYFCNCDWSWNVFDFGLVAVAFCDVAFSELTLSDNVNMNNMKTMRISMRLLRTAKILRTVRLIRFFRELRLILNSVLGSLVSLFWSIFMLLFIFFIFALVFVQGATIYLISGAEEMSGLEKAELRDSLGSAQAGILTLFTFATGADWSNFYDMLQKTGDWNCGVFLFFTAFSQFALLNILTGIFVENAIKLAQPDLETAALQQRKQELAEADELRRLCDSIDTDRTGFISQEQFMEQLRSDQFKARLALLGLDIKHAELFFGVVCSGFNRKSVEIDAFVAGAMRLKGLASALDLQTLTFGTKLIHENLLKLSDGLEERLERVLQTLELVSAVPDDAREDETVQEELETVHEELEWTSKSAEKDSL